MRAFRILCVAFLVTLSVCGCGRRGRVIPKDTMADIYAEMFVADQWLTDHPYARRTADTTFFYNPIFKKYGYTFRDYDKSLKYYIHRPDKFAKVMNRVDEILEGETKRLEEIKEEQARVREINSRIRGYVRKDFPDSLELILLKGNAERGDSVRTDTVKAAGKFAGIEFAADKRKTVQF